MRYFFPILIFIIVLPVATAAQSIGEWSAYTSFRTINASVVDQQGRIWIATEGGIAILDKGKLVHSFTPIEGLSRLNTAEITFDPQSDQIIAGYTSGDIDIINAESFAIRNLNDISRNTTFSSKAINDLLTRDGELFVATDFGMVIYDLSTFFVKDTYTKLGSLDPGVRLNDFFAEGNLLYVSTQAGIAYSALDGNYEPADWSVYDQANGFVTEDITSTGVFEGVIYASAPSGNYMFDGANWNTTSDFGSGEVLEFKRYSNSLFMALTSRVLYKKETAQADDTAPLPTTYAISLGDVSGNDVYFGTLNVGLGVLSLSDMSVAFITPPGPYQNSFDALSFDEGVLLSGSTMNSAGDFNINYGKGYHLYDGQEWHNFNGQNNTTLDASVYYFVVSTTSTENYYYFGSWGQGIARHDKETNDIFIFNETNSSLRGWTDDDPNYPVINGLETDSDGDVWAVSRFADEPLYVQSPGDQDWQSFPADNAVSGTDLYESLFLDRYGQKWIPLQSSSTAGTGLLILNTGDKDDPMDDVGVKLSTGANGNLPDNKVKAIIEDRNGEVWIGTERGIARFLFPDLIINGTSQERRAQWLINEDTTAVSRFLLRDLNVTAMAVNGANEKWIGSENQGLWKLNAEGSRILERFTAENSPLFSNGIKSIAIDDESGEVFIATDLGLISYTDVPTQAVAEMDKLKVYPNPFSYDRHTEMQIEGLGEETSIRIAGADGTVVNLLEARGGRVSWNGLDYRGQRVGTGVYFVIALAENGSGKGIGKVIIIR